LQALAQMIEFSVGHKDTKARKKYGPQKGTKRHKEMSHRGHRGRGDFLFFNVEFGV